MNRHSTRRPSTWRPTWLPRALGTRQSPRHVPRGTHHRPAPVPTLKSARPSPSPSSSRPPLPPAHAFQFQIPNSSSLLEEGGGGANKAGDQSHAKARGSIQAQAIPSKRRRPPPPPCSLRPCCHSRRRALAFIYREPACRGSLPACLQEKRRGGGRQRRPAAGDGVAG